MPSLASFLKRKKGYTFLELMVTVSILSIGVVGVFQGLLTSLDYQSELSRRLYALTALEHEIASLENQYRLAGSIPAEVNGKIIEAVLDHRTVPFALSVSQGFISGIDGLMPTETALTWTDRNREITLKRFTYLVNLNIKPAADAPIVDQP